MCSLLRLEAGTTPSRKDIDTSECFVPRAAASKSDLPEVITDHWLPILWEEGLLVECSLDQFTTMVDWVPLYTREGLERYLPVALSSFVSTGAPQLTAIVPPECRVGTDKEFLLSNCHQHGCLVRQSFTIGGRRRQLAFCPYCGVINENLQEVGLLVSPLPTTQGSRGAEPWDFCGTLCKSLIVHTRLLRVEPWNFCLPGCRPYIGGGASGNIFTFVNLS